MSFLDLAKAFDTVNHKILIGKLERYSLIQGKTFELMNSYLSNRKQIVKLEDKKSTEKKNTNGCSARNNTRTTVIYIIC